MLAVTNNRSADGLRLFRVGHLAIAAGITPDLRVSHGKKKDPGEALGRFRI